MATQRDDTSALQILSLEEIRDLASVLHDRHPEHALRLRFHLSTGVRAGFGFREAGSCRIEDLKQYPGFVIVRHQKGGGVRKAAFCDDFAQSKTLRDLLTYYEATERTHGPLFRHSYYQFYWALRQAAEATGTQQELAKHPSGSTRWRVHPHGLRHTWVALCRRRGISWDSICNFGWKGGIRSFPTVFRYYAHVDMDSSVADIQAKPIDLGIESPARHIHATDTLSDVEPDPLSP